MNAPPLDIWEFQAALSRRLLRWAALSVGIGTALATRKQRVWRGVGGQFVAWGAIDGVLALLGRRYSRRQVTTPDAQAPQRQAAARGFLRRLLWVNTGLDVLYVTGGLALARTRGRDDAFLRGTGWGIVVQGAFLFFFDMLHARQLTED